MRITIFGANGAVGQKLVEKILSEGHEVVAFTHIHHTLGDKQGLTIVEGDIHDPTSVENAVVGSEAIISTLGSWNTKEKDILSSAMTAIVPAMQKNAITRIISLTGAEARATGDRLGIIHRFAHFGLGIIAGKILRDSEQHIRLLEQSGLNWTVIRSPIMQSRRGGVYSLSDKRPLPWATISRDAVVQALVNELSEPHSQQAPFIR